MSKLGVSFPLTSVILGCNLLGLPTVWAQENPVNTAVSEIQTTTNLPVENEATEQVMRLADTSGVMVTSTDEINITNQSLGKSSVTTLNSSNLGSESLSNSHVISSTWENQVSAGNRLPSIIPDEQHLEEIPTNQLQSPQLYSQPPDVLEEFIRVEDLRDVSPGDWAYEALRSLGEKYRCLVGSGQGNFEGNRAITRYEFAAALNTCLLKIERIIDSVRNISPNQEDLAVVQRLQAEFAIELNNLATKVDNLEERVSFANDHQFSTTTVLRGTVDFNLISAFGDNKAVVSGGNPGEELPENLTLSARVNLNFDTSFIGRDRLRTNIIAGNVNDFGNSVTGTDMTSLIGAVNTGNNVRLGSLFYEFPIAGNRGRVAIAPVANFPTRIFPALNPVSSISNFGAESPIYSFAFGTGAVVYYNFTDQIGAGVAYLTTSGTNPLEGLFGGQYTALAQVTYTPSDRLAIAFTYGRYYAAEPGSSINVTGSKGSRFAQFPVGESTATSSNAYGLQFTSKLSDRLILGGWVSYFKAIAEGSPLVSGLDGSSGANADIWSWAVTAVVPDLGKLGSQLNFVLGMPPKVTNNDISSRLDQDSSIHFELSYSYPVSNRVFITPGILLITNPEHNAANDSIWVGLLRTTFTF